MQGPENSAESGRKFNLSLKDIKSFYIKHYCVAVLGGCGERVSAAKFPDLRENAGKFRRLSREGGKTARFPYYKSASYTQIPSAPEQGISWS